MSDLFIEVYRLRGQADDVNLTYLFREIPVGTTFNKFERDPEFIFKVTFKPPFKLGIDFPVQSYYMSYPKINLR